MTIDGVYIEDLIEGYTTISASGRESIDIDYTENTSSLAEKYTIETLRRKPRDISVSFVVEGPIDTAYVDTRAYLLKVLSYLNTILTGENHKFIFNDEPEVYYTGTVTSPPDGGISIGIGSGNSVITGSFTIRCSDPFKYALEESGPFSPIAYSPTDGAPDFDATVDYVNGDSVIFNGHLYECVITEGTTNQSPAEAPSLWDLQEQYGISVVNDGGYKIFPRFEIDFPDNYSGGSTSEEGDETNYNADDCGYIQILKNGTDYSLQFGDDEEKNVDTITQTKVKFYKYTKTKQPASWKSAVHSIGDFLPPLTKDVTTLDGTSYYAIADKGKGGVYANSYGKAAREAEKYYHGPNFIKNVRNTNTPNDSQWTFNFVQRFAADWVTSTGKKQMGRFFCGVFDTSGEILAGYAVTKHDTTSLYGDVRIYNPVTLAWTKPVTKVKVGWNGGLGFKTAKDKKGKAIRSYTGKNAVNSISRVRDEDGSFHIRYDIPALGYSKNFYGDLELTPPAYVVCIFAKYKNRPPLTRNVLYSAEFIYGDNDVVNSFTSGDQLRVDCNDASVYLNSVRKDTLGDVSNDWHNFYLDIGAQQFDITYSDWLTGVHVPNVKMFFRKRWL